MRVVTWNMGRAMDAFAGVHERAWQFLVSLGADIALVQEAIPPDWIREAFDVNRPHMLDHVFCDEGLAAHLVGSRSLPDIVSFLELSDHAPLIVDFDLYMPGAAPMEAVA